MPFKESKTVPKLITHYGRWTRADEDAFYARVSFKDWKGSSGLVPRSPSSPKTHESKKNKG